MKKEWMWLIMVVVGFYLLLYYIDYPDVGIKSQQGSGADGFIGDIY